MGRARRPVAWRRAGMIGDSSDWGRTVATGPVSVRARFFLPRAPAILARPYWVEGLFGSLPNHVKYPARRAEMGTVAPARRRASIIGWGRKELRDFSDPQARAPSIARDVPGEEPQQEDHRKQPIMAHILLTLARRHWFDHAIGSITPTRSAGSSTEIGSASAFGVRPREQRFARYGTRITYRSH